MGMGRSLSPIRAVLVGCWLAVSAIVVAFGLFVIFLAPEMTTDNCENYDEGKACPLNELYAVGAFGALVVAVGIGSAWLAVRRLRQTSASSTPPATGLPN